MFLLFFVLFREVRVRLYISAASAPPSGQAAGVPLAPPMEEFECDFSQFDVDGGTLACMPTSLCCARLFLDHTPNREDLHRVIRAGALLQKQWADRECPASGTPAAPTGGMQCWKDTVRMFPALVSHDVEAFFEGNGFVGATKPDDSKVTVLLSDVLDAADAHAQRRCAGVLTACNGSYCFATDGDFYYFFDPHGNGVRPNAGATMRRCPDRATFVDYLFRDLIPTAEGAEFHAVLLARRDPQTAPPDPVRTTGTCASAETMRRDTLRDTHVNTAASRVPDSASFG